MSISSDSSDTLVLPLHTNLNDPIDTEIEDILKRFDSASNSEVECYNHENVFTESPATKIFNRQNSKNDSDKELTSLSPKTKKRREMEKRRKDRAREKERKQEEAEKEKGHEKAREGKRERRCLNNRRR
ncbi:hypothetical protein NQ318_010941 [Aromia moschata]|uniref:Uncharacterized protein n=1 Tax=Aromia moschata TaxID=1265417 RepID=A0AAV8XES9_9CUCU|nr:hypothetical protein NQ318_010941 [Aromia moschata]